METLLECRLHRRRNRMAEGASPQIFDGGAGFVNPGPTRQYMFISCLEFCPQMLRASDTPGGL